MLLGRAAGQEHDRVPGDAVAEFRPGHLLHHDRVHLRLRATASASTHMISNMKVAPTRAVLPLGSKGGETSTTSPPIRLRPCSPRTTSCASRVVMPPISGVPVPGANTGSRPSTSKLT